MNDSTPDVPTAAEADENLSAAPEQDASAQPIAPAPSPVATARNGVNTTVHGTPTTRATKSRVWMRPERTGIKGAPRGTVGTARRGGARTGSGL